MGFLEDFRVLASKLSKELHLEPAGADQVEDRRRRVVVAELLFDHPHRQDCR